MSAEETQVSSEVAVREEKTREVHAQFEGASVGISTFLVDLQVAYEIAVRLVTTSFVPQSYANKPQEAAAAIVAGQGVGFGPMESLRSIDIIQGTPAMRAIALRALVVSKGHEIWVEESTPARAVVAGRRSGSDVTQRSVWDMDRAAVMNLTNKDNWKKQPGAMLVARATAECARLVAPDAILGIPYSAEELQDEQPSAGVAPARAVGGKVARLSGARELQAPSDVAPRPGTPAEAVEAVDGNVRTPEGASDPEAEFDRASAAEFDAAVQS